MIETTDNSEVSDYYEMLEDLSHPNNMVRVFALGKIKRTLMDFAKE